MLIDLNFHNGLLFGTFVEDTLPSHRNEIKTS